MVVVPKIERLDPTLDVVFKQLLTHEPLLLRDMLEGVLERPVGGLSILDPCIPGERVSDKRVVLDLRVALDDGSRADVEMQARATPALASRLVYYSARDFGDQLARGDDYRRISPTSAIAWLVDPLFDEVMRLHSVFELRERDTHACFGDQLAIHVLQLSSLSICRPSGYAGQVERWARFFTTREDAQLDLLASEDPIMKLAMQTLDQISQDPAAQRLARYQADEIKLHQIDLFAVREQTEARILLKQLGQRFGVLSEATRARVEKARSEQLEIWIERVLTAATLDEVLAG